MEQLVSRTVHIRVNGQSQELSLADLDVQTDASDAQIKQAVVRHLDLPATSLTNHVIVRTSQAIIVRPEALYG